MKTLNFRVIIFAFALIFGVVFSIPSLTQSDSGKKITLGLDLQGGLHMLLGIKSEVAIESKIKSIAGTVKYVFDDEDNICVIETGVPTTFELEIPNDTTINISDTLFEDI